jgi:menaquinone-specific isochorismate synthase
VSAPDRTGVTTLPAPNGLVATRLALAPGPAIDPYDLAGPRDIIFVAGGRTLVGSGRAMTIPLPRGLDGATDVLAVTEVLAALPFDDRLGAATSGVLAFGALPFDRSDRSSLMVPEVTYVREASGQEWVTVVTPDPSTLPSGPEATRAWLAARSGRSPDPRSPGPTPPHIVPLSSDESFRAMVARAVSLIDRGRVSKVVLARQVEVTMPEEIEVTELLRRWHLLEPDCAVFALPVDAGRFVGASPELLIERTGAQVHSRPLAGTTDRHVGPTPSVLPGELLRSRKDGREHRFVVQAIDDVLGPLCLDLETPDHPDLVHLHNLTHLGTSVHGTLAPQSDGTVPTALQLVAALHPTPAVGGVPTDAACSVISDLEPQPRGTYAGPVGYVDAQGDGRWMVGIRAMTIRGRDARLYAGVGIVQGSEPHIEQAETDLKLTAVFDALAPDQSFSTSASTSAAEADRTDWRITSTSA